MDHTGADKKMKKLTQRQALVLESISKHIDEYGYPPTFRELGDKLGISSTNGVNDHLRALERKGYISRGDGKSRAMRILYDKHGNLLDQAEQPGNQPSRGSQSISDVRRIPMVGNIAAGAPLLAVEQFDDFVHLGEDLVGRNQDVFGLNVRGDSMIEDGILDGDYIFITRTSVARDGEIVAVMVDGEATVKRIYREGDRIRLQPANSSMEPIYIHRSEFRDTSILGKVIGLFRRI